MSRRSIQLAATIVNRRAGDRAVSILHACNHEILLAVKGHGTTSSAVMDCLGLDEPEKDLVLGLSNRSDVDRLLHAPSREMEFYRPGHGVTLTLSPPGAGLAATDILNRYEDQTVPNSHTAKHKENISMTNSHSYELTASVIHTSLSAPVMEAARKAGCQGGTPIKAREIGTDAGEELFGITLSQEKTTLLILIPVDLRSPILKAVYETVAKETRKHAVAISLPMDAAERLAG